MPAVLWTGKLSPLMSLVINTSNILAWITGEVKNTVAMKQRIKDGYDGAFTEHVTMYDELGLKFQIKAAKAQLEELDLEGKEVLDVGAGTGALSFLVLEKGAAKVICGDISQYMLDQCRKKALDKGYSKDRIDFRLLDAESLPFDDNSFDVVITGMTLGLLPNQPRAIAEMTRVVRHGGCVSVGAHGPEHYWEAIDAYFRAITKRYVIGYRLEWWPRKETEVKNMLIQAGLTDIRAQRIIWRNVFPTGGEAYDFFAAISSSFWYAKFPQEKRQEDFKKVREYFEREKVTQVTDDVILMHGRKP
jgi:ubiquinone/menaquinone biosynthesis C-methylase UbiE